MIKRSLPIQHPGRIIRGELIDARKMTITEVATLIKVSRQAVSNVLNGKAEITAEMALRISTVFGGTPEIWLRIQSAFDLEKAAKKIKRLNLEAYRDDTTHLNSSKTNAKKLRKAILDMKKEKFINKDLIDPRKELH